MTIDNAQLDAVAAAGQGGGAVLGHSGRRPRRQKVGCRAGAGGLARRGGSDRRGGWFNIPGRPSSILARAARGQTRSPATPTKRETLFISRDCELVDGVETYRSCNIYRSPAARTPRRPSPSRQALASP